MSLRWTYDLKYGTKAYKCDRCGKLYGEDKAQIKIEKFGEKDSWWTPVDLCPKCTNLLEVWLQSGGEQDECPIGMKRLK